jgi:hypothetical protein
VFDTITLSEDVIIYLTSYIAVSEDITITEDTDVQLDPLQISVDDDITVLEDSPVSLVSYISVSDDVTVTEDVTATKGTPPLNINVYDELGPYKIIYTDKGLALRLSGDFYIEL